MTQVVVPEPYWKRALVPAVVALAAVAIGIGAWQVFFGGASGPPPVLAGGLDPKDVAVRYFEDATGGELQYVSDGLTEGLIARLQTVPVLNVVSRNGVAPFRDPAIAADSVARALEVGTVVGGTVDQVGDQIRVTARIYDGESGADLGRRANVSISTDSVLSGLDDLVEMITRFLRQQVGDEIEVRDLASGTNSTAAWTLVQRAERLRKQTEDADVADSVAIGYLTSADSLLRLAEAEDPQWAQATIDRGWIAYERALYYERDLAEVPWLDSAVALADAALSKNPRMPNLRALALRGTARYRLWQLDALTDPDQQAELLARAREDLETVRDGAAADPALVPALVTLSDLYYDLPTPDVPGAQLLAAEAYEEDAYLANAPVILRTLTWTHMDRESLTQARRWCEEGYRRFPAQWRFTHCRLWLLATPAGQPDVAEARRLATLLDSLREGREYTRVEAELLVGGVLARAGLADSARAVIDRAHQAISRAFDPDLDLYAVEAYVRTLLDDDDAAIDLLKEYVAANPGHDFSQRLGTWWWRSLRDSPRFRELGVG
jgi:TolB-like protein